MNGTCSVSPTLARHPGNGRRFQSSALEIYVKFGGGLGFRKDPEGCQTPTEKNNGVRCEPSRRVAHKDPRPPLSS